MATDKDEDLSKLIKDELIARLTAANTQLATYAAASAQRAKDELAITQKMALGLSRDQAIAVIERQKAHDQAETDAKAAPAL
jgi:hypothetical protein